MEAVLTALMIWCPDTANKLFPLVQRVHCSTLLVNTNWLQICYKQKTQVEKEKLTGFFFFFHILKSNSSLRPHPSPATNIFSYVLRRLNEFSNEVEVSNPVLFVYNVHKSNIKTQVEQGKEEYGLSYDVFLDGDLFLRWFCDAASSSRTGITRVPGSGGYWPARR